MATTDQRQSKTGWKLILQFLLDAYYHNEQTADFELINIFNNAFLATSVILHVIDIH